MALERALVNRFVLRNAADDDQSFATPDLTILSAWMMTILLAFLSRAEEDEITVPVERVRIAHPPFANVGHSSARLCAYVAVSFTSPTW